MEAVIFSIFFSFSFFDFCVRHCSEAWESTSRAGIWDGSLWGGNAANLLLLFITFKCYEAFSLKLDPAVVYELESLRQRTCSFLSMYSYSVQAHTVGISANRLIISFCASLLRGT